MKYLKYFLIVGVAISCLSLITVRTSRLSEGINPGNPIPDIQNLENASGTTLNLSDLKGQKVFVNFWAAYDASSRRDNILLTKIAEQASSSVKVLSVSFDKSKSVFEKTVAMDEIDLQNQFFANEDSRSVLVEQLKLDKGFRNYLIDEKGVILEVNLGPDDLLRHLTQN